MRSDIRSVLSILLLLCSHDVIAQIVYLGSPEFKSDSTTVYSENSANIKYNDNDGANVLEINVSSANHFRSTDRKKSMQLAGNFKWIRTDQANLLNRWLLFTQLNYHATSTFTWATILQTQRNRNLDVNERNLIGLGGVWHIIQGTVFRMSLTNYTLLEFEKADNMNYETFYRHSMRFSWRMALYDNHLIAQHRLYVQPLYNDMQDYKLLNQFRLDFPITEHFMLFAFAEYYLDRLTPKNRSQHYTEFQLGLSFIL